ncbi:hypothetical protein AMEX_G27137 [Astyanax mexicanus]|uniref:Secretory calcium-binding phosphoprotein 5 n=1 Tax=Astyanax mexicanus TaxID=7994 RepID=A0A8T2KS40_ASTMX|nr:hypothetical protein AMEX_G27137 [Astyanax mexicanus]
MLRAAMEVLFVAVLLFVGAIARPNGPPNGGGNFGPNGGGRFPNGPNGGGNFPFAPNGGGNFPFAPNGGGNFPFGPNGGGNFPFGPNGGGNFPSGPAPSQLNSWYGQDDSEEQGPNGFGPSEFRGGPQGGHRGPHGGGRPGGPFRPPFRPDGGRPVQPNITFTPLFRIDNVTAQNISASVPLKQGENVFILPPGSNGPPQRRPPVAGPQPYFKIIYNQNSTKIAFEFGTAQFVPPLSVFGSESDEYRPH